MTDQTSKDPIELTKDYLNEILDYRDGSLFWKKKISYKVVIGKKAGGYTKPNGYLAIRIHKKNYYVHRIIYIIHNENLIDGEQIDHINGVRNDNRIENLRKVSIQQNRFNNHVSKGFYVDNKYKVNKYIARIKLNKKFIWRKSFATEIEAHNAYLEQKKVHHVI